MLLIIQYVIYASVEVPFLIFSNQINGMRTRDQLTDIKRQKLLQNKSEQN